MSQYNWQTATPSSHTLADNAVHIWRANLCPPTDRLALYEALLSNDEHQRARRFHFVHHRDRFIAARGILRSILSTYLQQPPADLRFAYGAHGKPYLDPPSIVQFNMAHSHNLALYAFSTQRQIGIDVEYTRRKVAAMQIVERFFTATEIAALRRVPTVDQRQAFFNGWTRKEAFLKARGDGITVPLSSFSVSLIPDEPAALLWVQDKPHEINRWRLGVIEPGPDYQGALRVEGTDWQLSYWNWKEQITGINPYRAPENDV